MYKAQSCWLFRVICDINTTCTFCSNVIWCTCHDIMTGPSHTNDWPAFIEMKVLSMELFVHQLFCDSLLDSFMLPPCSLWCQVEKQNCQMSVHLSVYLSVHHAHCDVRWRNRAAKSLSICTSVHLSVQLPVQLSVHLSACLAIWPSICMSVWPSICMPVHLAIYLYVCLAIWPSVTSVTSVSIMLIVISGEETELSSFDLSYA